MRESRQTVPAEARPARAVAAAAAARTPAAGLLALQSSAGNRAALAALARQPAPPQLPAQVPGAVTTAQGAVRASLQAMIDNGGGPKQLVEDLRQRTKNDAAFASGGADLEQRTTALGTVRGHVGVGEYDYVTAGITLRDAVSPEDSVGQSYSPALYSRIVAQPAGAYLAGALGDPDGALMTVENLNAIFEGLLTELDDREALLQLELDGTVEKLAELRAKLELTTDAAARKDQLGRVAELARRALLLDAAARRVKAEDAKAAPPLGEALKRVGPQIEEIKAKATDEGETLKDLGDDPFKLTPQALGEAGRWETSTAGATVEPEEALPGTTAHASDVMTGELRDRVSQRTSVADSARAQVIPSGKSIPDLKRAFSYLHAFMSPEGNRADPMAQYALKWFEDLYGVLGHAGIEGGVGRGLMMHTWEKAIAGALPQARADFTYQGTKRQSYVRGTATDPKMRFADRYASREGDTDFAGEEASRRDYAQSTAREQKDRFTEAQRMQQKSYNASLIAEQAGPGVVATDVLALLPPKERTGWSYLIRTEDPLSHLVIQEERSMPMEVADWILAENQRRATLQGTHSTDGIGEKGVRSGGIEGATGRVEAERIEGQAPVKDARHPNLAGVDKERAATAGQPNTQRAATQTVIDELSKYLDGWFASAETSVRIAGVLAVANREHNIAADFSERVSPQKLGWAVAKAVGMAATLAAVARMGPIGKILSGAATQLMKHADASSPANIVTAASWFVAAGMADNLSSARAQAFMSRKFVDAIVSLMEDALGNFATAGSAAAWHAVGRSDVPTTAGGIPKMLGPVLEQPGMRKHFTDYLDGEIKSRGGPTSTDAEVVTLKAIRDALTGEVRPGSPHPDTVPLDASAAKKTTPDPAATKKPDDDPWAGGGSRHAPDTEPILKSPGGTVKEIPSSTPGHPPGKVHADVDEVSAVAIYTRARLDSPHLEVGIYHHPATGRYVVVHGEADRITGEWRKSDPDYAGKWVAVKHFHPGADDAARLPSHEDFAHLFHNMKRGDQGELIKTVVWVDYTKADGTKLHTVYGYDPAKGGWFVDFINPKTGKSETQSFPKGPWADKNYDKLLEAHGAMGAPPHLRPEDLEGLDIKAPRSMPKPESYTGIDPDKWPPGYKFRDAYDNGVDPTSGRPVPDADGTITLRTYVTGPGGEKGEVSRSYNPVTKELKLVDSQLDKLPRDVPAHEGAPMVEGRGHPRWAYFSMRQMRILGVSPGAPAKVVASEVLHVKTLIAIHQAAGGTASKAGDRAKVTGDVLAKTPMYYMTNQQLLAAGTEVKAAHLDGGSETTIGSIMKTWEDGTPPGPARKQLIDEHNQMLRDAGMNRLTPVLQNFNIVLETVPIGTLAGTAGGATGSGP